MFTLGDKLQTAPLLLCEVIHRFFHTYTHMQTHTYIHIYIYIYICTYIYIYIYRERERDREIEIEIDTHTHMILFVSFCLFRPMLIEFRTHTPNTIDIYTHT